MVTICASNIVTHHYISLQTKEIEVSFLKIACSVLSYQSIKFLNILIVFQIIEMPIDIIFFLEIQIYILNFFINIKKKQLNCVDCVKFFRTHHIDTTFVEFYGIN
jgi:hypothetical protein